MSNPENPAANATVEPETADVPEQAARTGPAEPGSDVGEARYAALHDQYLRLAADFENTRKRHAQEQDALRKYGAEQALCALFPVLDNLDRAQASLNEGSDPKLLYQSFRLMYKQLMDALEGLGLQRLETVGQPFDPQFHEAVSQVHSAEHPENTIVTEMQPGFQLHGRVLRPAMVSVSAGPADEPAPANPFTPPNEPGSFAPQ